MHERFAQRIREGLAKIAATCRRKKQNPLVIAQRVGRLRGLNSRAAGLFDVTIATRPDGGASVTWRETEDWRRWSELSEGCYLLRGNIADWEAEDLWRTYIQLTEAEAAFRIHKSDLRIRPIWHQKPDCVQAHILVCFLAYVLLLRKPANFALLGLPHPTYILPDLGNGRYGNYVRKDRNPGRSDGRVTVGARKARESRTFLVRIAAEGGPKLRMTA